MTREKAIDIFKCLAYHNLRPSEEEIDEAIKALEQEPCEDCISRQDVIDIINFEDKWLFDAKSHNADTKIAFSGLKSKVKDLPSVAPKAESEG